MSRINIHRVTAEQACEIILDAFPMSVTRATFHKIVPTADRSQSYCGLQRSVSRIFDEKVLPEMSAKVNFLAPIRQEASRGGGHDSCSASRP